MWRLKADLLFLAFSSSLWCRVEQYVCVLNSSYFEGISGQTIHSGKCVKMLQWKFFCFYLLDLFFAFWTKSGLWCSSASTTHKTASFFPPSFIFPAWDGCVLPVSADAPSLCLLLPLHQGMQLCACAHPAFTNTDGGTSCWHFLNVQQSRTTKKMCEYGLVLFKRNHRAAMLKGRKLKSYTLQNIHIYVWQLNINNSPVLFSIILPLLKWAERTILCISISIFMGTWTECNKSFPSAVLTESKCFSM